jgi:hypothetical protein
VASIETGSGRGEETGFMPSGYRPSAPRSNPWFREYPAARRHRQTAYCGRTAVCEKSRHVSFLLTFDTDIVAWSRIMGRLNDPSGWRLSEPGDDNLGLASTEQGLLLGRTLLIEVAKDMFEK